MCVFGYCSAAAAFLMFRMRAIDDGKIDTQIWRLIDDNNFTFSVVAVVVIEEN